MQECKFGAATIRIHNEPDQKRIEAATEKFLKQVHIRRNRLRNEARQKANQRTTQAAGKVET